MNKQANTIDPTRVQIAREIAGLSKVELASFLGVTPRTINTFENEGAPGKHRDALATATGRPTGFFTDESFERIDVENVLFRAAKKVPQKAKNESTSLGAVGLQFYARLVAPYSLPTVDVPTVDSSSPEIAAQRIRTAWSLREDPLPNMIQLFESRGIRVLSLPKAIQKLDAFSYWYTDGKPYIFLNTSETAERVRFDLAHELGHLVMHARGATEGANLEKEADHFAAEFLMPSRAINRDMPTYADVSTVLKLKKKYRVSAMAMNYRGGELGILKEWGLRQNYAELAKRGFRLGEPGGLTLDRSRVIPFVVSQMREKGQRMAQLAAEVGVTMQDVNGFLFGEVLAPVSALKQDDMQGSSDYQPPVLSVVR